MQLRLLRPKDAPGRRKRAPIVSTADAPPCGICTKQLSRYTCPACNLPYCSLACFRAPQHSSCSEAFAKQSLREDVQGVPKEDGDMGRDKMMGMLREFEEQQRELEEMEREQREEEEDEESDTEEGRKRRKEREELEKKLVGVNLDALAPEDLLSLLTPEQQAAFQSTLQDPSRVTKLVEDQFEGEEPWWIIEEERKMLSEMKDARKAAVEAQRQQGAGVEGEEEDEESEEEEEEVRPPMLDETKLPPLKKGEDGKAAVSPKLVFNVVAVLFAYAYTLRTFAITSFTSLSARSSERTAAIQVLTQLLPFLVARSASAVDNLNEAVECVVAREEPSRFPPPLVAMLLQDLSSLLRPAPIAAITSSASSSILSSHSLATALAALFDLHHLFTTVLSTSSPSASSASGGPIVSRPLIARPSSVSPLTKQQRQQCTLASAKLLFYASLLVSDVAVPVVCKGIAEQAEQDAERREKEKEREEKAVEKRKEQLKGKKEAKREVKEEVVQTGPKIVEL
ncbi:hypothetical protein JCM8547_003410 [Rhodosporidiobolus lusitaniae]